MSEPLKNMQNVQTTNTLGYYNGNKWPIHVVISELGLTLNLKPGEYILDAQGRPINDNFFDGYAKPFQLSKELSKNGPVPLIVIPRVVLGVQDGAHQQSVRSVPNFDRTKNGSPIILPAPRAQAPPPVNQSSHRGMSVEEARRIGLIGKPREVPEDYGITDTAGRPVGVDQAPPIRYAMESTPRVRQSEQLPAELTNTTGLDPNQASLMKSLSGAASANVDNPHGFMNEVTRHAAAPISSAPIRGQRQIGAVLAEANSRLADPPEEPLPAPNIFAAGQASPTGVATPDPLAEARARAKKPVAAGVKPAALKDEKPFICNVDGTSFRFRSQLETYAKRKFPAQVEAIMAPYPPAEQPA